jgi:hypothetical protein
MKYLAIYVPTCDKDGAPCDAYQRERMVTHAQSTFSTIFGAASLCEGEGSWHNDDRKLITEHHTIVYIYTSDEEHDKAWPIICTLAETIRDTLSQQCVMIVSIDVTGAGVVMI